MQDLHPVWIRYKKLKHMDNYGMNALYPASLSIVFIAT